MKNIPLFPVEIHILKFVEQKKTVKLLKHQLEASKKWLLLFKVFIFTNSLNLLSSVAN